MTTRRDILINKYIEFTKISKDYLGDIELFPPIENIDISNMVMLIITTFNDDDVEQDLLKIKMLMASKQIIIKDINKKHEFYGLVLGLINFIRNLT